MDSLAITNLDELRAEIAQLKISALEQGDAIALRFSSPSAVFTTVRSFFSSSKADADSNHEDIFSLISRFLIPFTLNKTIFSGSGFLVKMLVGVVSQKAAGFVNEGAIEKLISEGKSLFKKLIHSKIPDEQV